MGSVVLDPAVRVAIDQVAAGLEALQAAGVVPADAVDAVTVIREVEVLGRRVAAVQVRVLDEIDRAGLHRVDGHGSAKVMVRHVAHLSNTAAARRASSARALRALPEVAARFEAGRIGPCQVERIARAYANTRIRGSVVGKDRALARLAEMDSYLAFDAKVTEWVRRVDEDGTADANQRSHENRDATLVQDFDGSWTLAGGCASLDGMQLADIFSHFVDAETLTDWEKIRAELGDAATVEDLPRTPGQRRFDALFAIFQRAASAVEAGGGSQIVTNLVMDLETFERTARRFAGADPGPVDDTLDGEDATDGEPDLDEPVDLDAILGPDPLGQQAQPMNRGGDPDNTCDGAPPSGRGRSQAAETSASGFPSGLAPTDADVAATGGRGGRVGHRCSSLDGRPVDTREAVAAALVGDVRRVVVGADGVVIDLGRRRRLFTGAAQLAVRLSSIHCYWPGCNVPVTQCQTDHLIPWADRGGGSTNPGNGGPACGRHNRLKERGFSVLRDQTGGWHVTRPDGTKID
jgi:hypothetical protein